MHRRFIGFFLGCLGLLLSSTSANASFSSTLRDGYNTLTDNVAQTWNEPEHYDLYIPAVTWHARFATRRKPTGTTSAPGVPVLAFHAGMIKGTGMASI